MDVRIRHIKVCLLRHRHAGVSQYLAECVDIHAGHQTSLGEVVPERMRRDPLLNPRPADVLGKVGFIGGYLHPPPCMPYREQVGRLTVS